MNRGQKLKARATHEALDGAKRLDKRMANQWKWVTVFSLIQFKR